MTSSERTLLYVCEFIGPVSGLRPPSPKRYSDERSASETTTFLRPAASLRNVATSPAGTVRSTGSLSPPCGGSRSDITNSPQCVARTTGINICKSLGGHLTDLAQHGLLFL